MGRIIFLERKFGIAPYLRLFMKNVCERKKMMEG